MVLPSIYRKYGEGSIASYDWTDIASGLGYVNFTCGTSSPAGTITYQLFKEAMEQGNSATDSLLHERYSVITNDTYITFALSAFNLATVIRGKVFVTFTVSAANGGTGNMMPTVQLLLNSTVLGTTTGSEITLASEIKTWNLSFDVASVSAAPSDILYFKIKLTMQDAATVDHCIYHDSLNRDRASFTPVAHGIFPAVTASLNPTELIVKVPFRIDL